MPQKVSHSLLDPWLTAPLKRFYPHLAIPSRWPPELLVGIGHAWAVAGAVGFALSTRFWWGGLLAAVGVALNHTCDVLDGTHARSTGQCRNGGELLDHFVDPLSFAWWAAALGYSCGRLELGLFGVICIYATAVLTNIKAKIVGEFTLARFGPTEFKSLLVAYGLAIGSIVRFVGPAAGSRTATVFVMALLAAGVVQLAIGLVRAVRDVNRHEAISDDGDWQLGG